MSEKIIIKDICSYLNLIYKNKIACEAPNYFISVFLVISSFITSGFESYFRSLVLVYFKIYNEI